MYVETQVGGDESYKSLMKRLSLESSKRPRYCTAYPELNLLRTDTDKRGASIRQHLG